MNRQEGMLAKARELKAMLNEGIITKEEFEQEKKKLLSQKNTVDKQDKDSSNIENLEQELLRKNSKPIENVLAIAAVFSMSYMSFLFWEGYHRSVSSNLAESGATNASDPSAIAFGIVLLWFIHWLIFVMFTTNMARKRGRSIPLAILGAYFFGLLSVFYYLSKGDSTELKVLKEEKVRKQIR